MIKKRRALSPVIATILLVSIALVLAVIIFLWARSFIGEGLEKEGRAIDKSCEEVVFSAEAFPGTLTVENLGNVAIYGVEIKRVDNQLGTEISQAEQFKSSITIGATGNVEVPLEIGARDTIMVIPVLLGEKGSQTGTHKCDDDYGVEITVGD